MSAQADDGVRRIPLDVVVTPGAHWPDVLVAVMAAGEGMSGCAFAGWTALSRDHRAALRSLPGYMLHRDRLAHLYDKPRCPLCAKENQ